MLGTTLEDLAQFLHQEERLDSVRTRWNYITCNGIHCLLAFRGQFTRHVLSLVLETAPKRSVLI